jgi:hypothetical protein
MIAWGIFVLLPVTQPCAARGMIATPKLKIIVRLNEPLSPCGDVHRRIPEALRADSDDFGRSFRAEVGHLFRLMSAGHSN